MSCIKSQHKILYTKGEPTNGVLPLLCNTPNLHSFVSGSPKRVQASLGDARRRELRDGASFWTARQREARVGEHIYKSFLKILRFSGN